MDSNITKVTVSMRENRVTEQGLALEDKVRSYTIDLDNLVHAGDLDSKVPSCPIKRAEIEFLDGTVLTLECTYKTLEKSEPADDAIPGEVCEEDVPFDCVYKWAGCSNSDLPWYGEIQEEVIYGNPYPDYLWVNTYRENWYRKHNNDRPRKFMKTCFLKRYYNRPREFRMKKSLS